MRSAQTNKMAFGSRLCVALVLCALCVSLAEVIASVYMRVC